MTAVTLLPDVERLLVNFLKTQPEITTLISTRVYTELPKDKTWPLVRVHQYGSLPAAAPRWIETATVQIEAFGGTKNEAWQLAETCAAVMQARLEGTHDEGIVTGVSFTGFTDLPDDTFEPAKPRRLFSALISVHP